MRQSDYKMLSCLYRLLQGQIHSDITGTGTKAITEEVREEQGYRQTDKLSKKKNLYLWFVLLSPSAIRRKLLTVLDKILQVWRRGTSFQLRQRMRWCHPALRKRFWRQKRTKSCAAPWKDIAYGFRGHRESGTQQI